MSYVSSYNNRLLMKDGNLIGFEFPNPYNPLGLPPYTVRMEFSDGYTPDPYGGFPGTKVQVSESPNVWDFTYENSNWHNVFHQWLSYPTPDKADILGGNITGVTNLDYAFSDWFTKLPLMDTRYATTMNRAFASTRVTEMPNYPLDSATNLDWAFALNSNCTSGFDELYQQASTKAIPVTSHTKTFYQTNGTPAKTACENIPSDWKE